MLLEGVDLFDDIAVKAAFALATKGVGTEERDVGQVVSEVDEEGLVTKLLDQLGGFFSIPLGDFTAENRSLDLTRLQSVRFVFDVVHGGEVSIDQIGFSDLDPAFLGARAENPGN